MANLRNLKKDIDYLSMEVISDCWTFMYLYPDKKKEECNTIIDDTIQMRDELVTKANHPAKEDAKATRKFYTELRKELFERVDALFVRISGLNK